MWLSPPPAARKMRCRFPRQSLFITFPSPAAKHGSHLPTATRLRPPWLPLCREMGGGGRAARRSGGRGLPGAAAGGLGAAGAERSGGPGGGAADISGAAGRWGRRAAPARAGLNRFGEVSCPRCDNAPCKTFTTGCKRRERRESAGERLRLSSPLGRYERQDSSVQTASTGEMEHRM